MGHKTVLSNEKPHFYPRGEIWHKINNLMLGAHLPTNADSSALWPVGVKFATTAC